MCDTNPSQESEDRTSDTRHSYSLQHDKTISRIYRGLDKRDTVMFCAPRVPSSVFTKGSATDSVLRISLHASYALASLTLKLSTLNCRALHASTFFEFYRQA